MTEESEAVAGRMVWRRGRRRPLRLPLGGLILLLSLLAAVTGGVAAQDAVSRKPAPPAVTPDVEGLLSYFETIVFEAEYRPPQTVQLVAKWQEPLRIRLSGTVSRLNRLTVERHARTLAELTGLDMQVLPPAGEGGNVGIHFLTRKEMDGLTIENLDPGVLRRLGAGGGCYFLSSQMPPGRLVRSLIVVNIERDQPAIHHCLLEELTQSLGLPNDSNTMRPSIFSDLDRLPALAPQDVLLLRTLYHPDMTPGMNRVEARTRARTIITDMVRFQGISAP